MLKTEVCFCMCLVCLGSELLHFSDMLFIDLAKTVFSPNVQNQWAFKPLEVAQHDR